MIKFLFVSCTVVFMSMFLPSAYAQSKPSEDTALTKVFKESKSLVSELRITASKEKEDYFLLENTEDSLSALISISAGKIFSTKYLFSVKVNQSVLVRYQVDRDVTLLRRVSADFATKAAFAESNCEPFKDISVTASTINRLNVPIGGYRVWFAPTGSVITTDNFGSLSTPTTRGLVAGDYYFWAVKGNLTNDRIVISISASSECGPEGAKQNIDLLVPSEKP